MTTQTETKVTLKELAGTAGKVAHLASILRMIKDVEVKNDGTSLVTEGMIKTAIEVHDELVRAYTVGVES